jgi:hypothetical protein
MFPKFKSPILNLKLTDMYYGHWAINHETLRQFSDYRTLKTSVFECFLCEIESDNWVVTAVLNYLLLQLFCFYLPNYIYIGILSTNKFIAYRQKKTKRHKTETNIFTFGTTLNKWLHTQLTSLCPVKST